MLACMRVRVRKRVLCCAFMSMCGFGWVCGTRHFASSLSGWRCCLQLLVSWGKPQAVVGLQGPAEAVTEGWRVEANGGTKDEQEGRAGGTLSSTQVGEDEILRLDGSQGRGNAHCIAQEAGDAGEAGEAGSAMRGEPVLGGGAACSDRLVRTGDASSVDPPLLWMFPDLMLSCLEGSSAAARSDFAVEVASQLAQLWRALEMTASMHGDGYAEVDRGDGTGNSTCGDEERGRQPDGGEGGCDTDAGRVTGTPARPRGGPARLLPLAFSRSNGAGGTSSESSSAESKDLCVRLLQSLPSVAIDQACQLSIRFRLLLLLPLLPHILMEK